MDRPVPPKHPVGAPRLVFVHVMKCAGTSVTEWVQQHYHYGEVLHEASVWDELLAVPPEVRARKKFIRGHFGIQIETQYRRKAGFRYFTILRDPAERVISQFWHVTRAPDGSHLEFAREPGFSIEDFLEHPRAVPFASNYQVRNFAFDTAQDLPIAELKVPHRVFTGDIGAEQLERAKAAIEQMEVVGIAEELDQFVLGMSRRFGFYPDEDLRRKRSYRDHNTVFSPEILKKIRRLNELDYELYEGARSRASELKSKTHFLPRPGQALMTPPIDASRQPLVQWAVDEPFFGKGWADVQCPHALPNAPHRWMVGSSEAEIMLRVAKGARYLVIVDVLRFVSEEQADGFSLLVDSVEVLPTRIGGKGPAGGLFAVALGPVASDECRLTFRVKQLKTFKDVNPAATDATPRGLAVQSLTLVKLDQDGRPDIAMDRDLRSQKA